MTDEVLASIIYINPHKKKLSLRAMDTDLVYYVIKGDGKVTIDDETTEISEGSLILVAKEI